ncbi:hypothetical protein PG995_007580 [Apiospora arundinis]
METKLIEKPSIKGTIVYLTLSHCWGSRMFMTLTGSDYDTFVSKGIPLHAPDFSPLFRDLMQVTLDLGYNYIWIDSLCIIQNAENASDWARECPNAGEYYANADIPLSAASFRDGRFGLFGIPGLREYGWAIVRSKDHRVYRLGAWKDTEAMIKETPLMRRGWMLQERLFLGKQYFRETIRGFGSDTLTSKTTPGFGWMGKTISHAMRLFARKHDIEIDATADAVARYYERNKALRAKDITKPNQIDNMREVATNNWYLHVVRPYSAAHLTYSGDKLPAISGLAAAYHRVLGDVRSLAGHWSHDLLYTLAWKVSIDRSDARALVVVVG